MSTILGSNGKPLEDEVKKDGPNGADKSEVQDVRTVPTGVLLFNLCLCSNGMQMNRMTLDEMTRIMKEQKVIADPPEVAYLKEALQHQLMARNVMVGELNYRFRDLDKKRLEEIQLEVVDRSDSPPAHKETV